LECRSVFGVGVDGDVAAVSHDELARDVEPEAKSSRFGFATRAIAASEWLEQDGLLRTSDGYAFVVHADVHDVTMRSSADRDRSVRKTVRECIADQVREPEA
jgi:hypothetical protein